MAGREKYLRRYTDLSALFYLLAERKLTLLDPRRWDDKNDSYCLRQYRTKKALQSVLAVCFVQTSERYHFWKVFGAGIDGVRIKFNRVALLRAADKVRGVRHGKVNYKRLEEIRRRPKVDDLPFVKRWGFRDEKEYRVVYESSDEVSKFDISIPLSCIDSIKLNPWLDRDLFEHVRDALHNINDGCRSLNVVQSSLIDSEQWRGFAKRATA
jgi:hypothetical protein